MTHWTKLTSTITTSTESQYSFLLWVCLSYATHVVLISFIVAHPYYGFAYIDMAWGGVAEQAAEIEAGNPDAKNWKHEAMKIVEAAVSPL